MVGIGPDDGEDDVRYLCEKLVKLRIFDDEAGVMNRSVVDAGGDVLVVSQFTLYASTRKGPCCTTRSSTPSPVETGRPAPPPPCVNFAHGTASKRWPSATARQDARPKPSSSRPGFHRM